MISQLVQMNAALSDEVTTLRSERAQKERRDEILQAALSDRDAWAKRVEELEDQIDLRVNAGVSTAVARIEERLTQGAIKAAGGPEA